MIVCLLIGTVAAHAHFFFNDTATTEIYTLSLHDALPIYTETDKAHFGLEVKGGAFLIDNVALLLDAGATWQGGGTDVYTLGVGGRYYFNKIGVFLGADVNLNRYNWDGGDKTRFGFGMEGGYAFFLSRTVTIEPAVYWDINKDRSEFGLKVGFGFYF